MSTSLVLDGIGVLELKQLLDKLNGHPDCKKDILSLKQEKPHTNYRVQRIPCTSDCKIQHPRPHHQFVKIVNPKRSQHCIAAHFKVAGLTPDCTLYVNSEQKTLVDRLMLKEDLLNTASR